MIVDEPNVQIAAEFRKDLPVILADCEAGRVLYIVGTKPHEGGWWGVLQEFARIANEVIKKRRPAHARLLLVYDQEKTP